jgi:hypothetical protein
MGAEAVDFGCSYKAYQVGPYLSVRRDNDGMRNALGASALRHSERALLQLVHIKG